MVVLVSCHCVLLFPRALIPAIEEDEIFDPLANPSGDDEPVLVKVDTAAVEHTPRWCVDTIPEKS